MAHLNNLKFCISPTKFHRLHLWNYYKLELSTICKKLFSCSVVLRYNGKN